MGISRQREVYHIYVGDTRITQTANYSYLGVNIEEENRQETEIDRRIAIYNYNVGALYPLIKERYVARECKLQIYKTILKLKLLYGAEAWSLTTKTKGKLQAATTV